MMNADYKYIQTSATQLKLYVASVTGTNESTPLYTQKSSFTSPSFLPLLPYHYYYNHPLSFHPDRYYYQIPPSL